MSKESDVADILKADATLMAFLTGGIYTDIEIGIEGFRRGADSPTNAAFDIKGILLPCAVVREGDEGALSGIRSAKEKVVGISQSISIYFYQHREADTITQAMRRSFSLLENLRLPGTYPLTWIADTPIYYDTGPIANSTTRRQEWRCVFLRKAA